MKKNYFKTIIMIFLVVAMLGGTTFAWFTASATVPDNEFTAGTVHITSERAVGVGKIITSNWNPGDSNDVNLKVVNDGTKSIYVRAKINAQWMSSYQRVLIIYTGKTVQLLTVEWNSLNKELTGENGPIVTGKFGVTYPGTAAYMNGKFTNLSNETFLSNNTSYKLWCLDKTELIQTNTTYNVQVFDPVCNPDWYNDVSTKTQWESIPWGKISYIINANYLSHGYSTTEIQDAIWHFTNSLPVSGKALAIVTEAEASGDLPASNVDFTIGEGWKLGSDGYWYYMNAIPGTYSGTPLAGRTIWFNNKVHLNGLTTGNEYQGKTFTMNVAFESVQSSHDAVHEVWPNSPY